MIFVRMLFITGIQGTDFLLLVSDAGGIEVGYYDPCLQLVSAELVVRRHSLSRWLSDGIGPGQGNCHSDLTHGRVVHRASPLPLSCKYYPPLRWSLHIQCHSRQLASVTGWPDLHGLSWPALPVAGGLSLASAPLPDVCGRQIERGNNFFISIPHREVLSLPSLSCGGDVENTTPWRLVTSLIGKWPIWGFDNYQQSWSIKILRCSVIWARAIGFKRGAEGRGKDRERGCFIRAVGYRSVLAALPGGLLSCHAYNHPHNPMCSMAAAVVTVAHTGVCTLPRGGLFTCSIRDIGLHTHIHTHISCTVYVRLCDNHRLLISLLISRIIEMGSVPNTTRLDISNQ